MDPIQLGPDVEMRELQPDDADTVYGLMDAERDRLGQWLPFVHWSDSAQVTRAFIEESRTSDSGVDGLGIWMGGEFAGGIGLRIDPVHNSGEIGYWLGSQFEGRGLVTAACRALIDLAFGEMGLHRVTVVAEPENLRSRAIPERLGFKREALLRDSCKVGDRYEDVHVYGLLDGEWPAS
jgi:ribosomal-protein-serine acetyltransferase